MLFVNLIPLRHISIPDSPIPASISSSAILQNRVPVLYPIGKKHMWNFPWRFHGIPCEKKTTWNFHATLAKHM